MFPQVSWLSTHRRFTRTHASSRALKESERLAWNMHTKQKLANWLTDWEQANWERKAKKAIPLVGTKCGSLWKYFSLALRNGSIIVNRLWCSLTFKWKSEHAQKTFRPLAIWSRLKRTTLLARPRHQTRDQIPEMSNSGTRSRLSEIQGARPLAI
jgi:hypothetical protein